MSAVRHPLIELTTARFREFLREPEALFWAFAFPILMTCALGVAFEASPLMRRDYAFTAGIAAAYVFAESRNKVEVDVED